MAQEQLETIIARITKNLEENEDLNAKPANESDILEPKLSATLKSLLAERKSQRAIIFNLSIWLSAGSFLFLILIITVQAYYRLDNQNFSFFNGRELEVFTVSVFGQVLGLTYIIAKALWDDTSYIDSLK